VCLDAVPATETTSQPDTFSMAVAMVTVSARVGEHYAIRRLAGCEPGPGMMRREEPWVPPGQVLKPRRDQSPYFDCDGVGASVAEN